MYIKDISPAQNLSVDSEIDVPTLDHEEIIGKKIYYNYTVL